MCYNEKEVIKIKILLLNHFPLTGSGSGVYTQNIADSLTKAGHEVSIIMPENEIIQSGNEHIHLYPIYFQNQEHIENSLPFNFPCFTTHPRSTMAFTNLSEDQLELYIKSFDNKIKEVIDIEHPDIIHAGHIWILPSIAGKYNIPLVITAHGTDLIGYKQSKRFRHFAENAVDKAKFIITISEENSKLVKEIFPKAQDKTILIPNGYNSNNFYPKSVNKQEFLSSFNIKNYPKIVSFAGKFTSFKGIDLLLKAATIYENDDTATILAGNGELFNDMQKLAKDLKLKNIYFIGNQPHDILNNLYNIADVSLVPSRNEAFGLVVIEALACGTPVIGSNNGGIPDIINNQVGLLFEPENYQDLANKIKKVLDKDIKFDSQNIAEYAKNNYSQDNFTKQLTNIYNNAKSQK